MASAQIRNVPHDEDADAYMLYDETAKRMYVVKAWRSRARADEAAERMTNRWRRYSVVPVRKDNQ
jgi:hypothetical protein